MSGFVPYFGYRTRGRRSSSSSEPFGFETVTDWRGDDGAVTVR